MARRVASVFLAVLGALYPVASTGQAFSASEVVTVERSFAARVQEAGVKAGFSEYLAAAGVVFRPGPVNGLEFFAARPASPGILSWRPVQAGISAAGDLGWSTGPFESRAGPAAPVGGTGWYLSVWGRQEDGSLRLLADHGMAALVPPDTTEALNLWAPGDASPSPAPAPTLDALDRAAGEPLLLVDARTYVAGGLHAGAAARRAAFGAPPPALEPLGGGQARSGDLGYTYGSYRWRQEQGYYLRVWQREAGAWGVVAEVYAPNR